MTKFPCKISRGIAGLDGDKSSVGWERFHLPTLHILFLRIKTNRKTDINEKNGCTTWVRTFFKLK